MKAYGIVDELGNDADEYAYVNIVEAGMAADEYSRKNGKAYIVKELSEITEPGIV